MKKRKTIIAAVVLLLVFVVGRAVAYFTDTESVTNTFTIGNVDITLTEPNWDDTDDNDNDGICFCSFNFYYDSTNDLYICLGNNEKCEDKQQFILNLKNS